MGLRCREQIIILMIFVDCGTTQRRGNRDLGNTSQHREREREEEREWLLIAEGYAACLPHSLSLFLLLSLSCFLYPHFSRFVIHSVRKWGLAPVFVVESCPP